MDRLELDPVVLSALQLWTWLSHATRQGSGSTGGLDADAVSAAHFLRLWKAVLGE